MDERKQTAGFQQTDHHSPLSRLNETLYLLDLRGFYGSAPPGLSLRLCAECAQSSGKVLIVACGGHCSLLLIGGQWRSQPACPGPELNLVEPLVTVTGGHWGAMGGNGVQNSPLAKVQTLSSRQGPLHLLAPLALQFEFAPASS